MSYKNTKFRFFAKLTLTLFLVNTIGPTLQFAFADSTQYYVDATGWSDSNDGLTPGTAWQTLAKVSSEPFLQGDTITFDCNDSWTGGLNLNNLVGSPALPITFASYGSCSGARASIDSVMITNSSYLTLSELSINDTLGGTTVSVSDSSYVSLLDSDLSGNTSVCFNALNSTWTTIWWSTMGNCQYGLSLLNTDASVSNNIFSGITENAVTVLGNNAVTISNNTFSNIGESAVLYGELTNVSQNNITNACTTASTTCAGIRNNPLVSGNTNISITDNIIKNVGVGTSLSKNAWIMLDGVNNVTASRNSVQNATYGLRIVNGSYNALTQNTLLFSRVNSLSVEKNGTGTTEFNTFNNNTILQKNPDYPYVEIRDETPGSWVASGLITANANTIYPNYKPNTSYVRTVKFGWETEEYTKNTLSSWDTNVNKFEYFAYRAYTNTGSPATANLLTNPDFDTDVTNWSVAAYSGLAPSISHNPVGTYLGWSATLTPAWWSADRIWLTNDTTLSVTSGQTYLVTWYIRSSSGMINLRSFLHQSGDRTNIYSDRIAETFASATWGTFSFYFTINTTASDANLTFETSNQDVNYEIDAVNLYRMNAVIKNSNSNEILVFSNTGSVAYDQSCPGWVSCFAYVDGVNTPISWTTSIPAYSTRFVLWNASPNILNAPSCTLVPSAGSVPTGQPVTVDWTTTNSDSQWIIYPTYTGSLNEPAPSSWSATFIPPFDNVSTITISALNDVWPNQCSIQVTTTNTAPNIYPSTTNGSEDAIQIDGTLSGVDLNPGDSIFFEQNWGNVTTNGAINVDLSGSFQYFPNPNFCGTDDFSFRAFDQGAHYADPVVHTISVECVNDNPVAVNDLTGATAGVPTIVNVLVNDTDIDNIYQAQTLTINNHSTGANGIVSINANRIEYTSNFWFSGAEVISYRAIDQSGALSNTGTLTINVTIANTPPVVTNTGYTITEDTILSYALTGSDAEDNMLTYTASTLPLHGTLVVLSNGSFTYTPNPNYFWSDSFDYIANDGSFDSSPATVSLTIDSVNDAPATANDSYSLNQDTVLFIPVMNNDSDADSSSLTLTGFTNPSNGSIVVTGTGFTYTPNSGYIGSDMFSYQIEDDTLLVSNTSNVLLNVTSTNAPPVANTWSFIVNEDAILTNVVTGSDPESSTLTYVLDILPIHGNITLSATGSFTYTPNANYFGPDSFSFHVSDGVLDSSGALVDISVNSVNDIPTANPGSFTATGNNLANSGNVLMGVVSGSDLESSLLTYNIVTSALHGALAMSATWGFTYTPAIGYIGADSFTFTTSDGTANSTSSTISINVIDNGLIYVPPLDHFVITSTMTAYVGQPFTVSVQARDNVNLLISGYTGSIVFSSPTDTWAVLPAWGSAIPFMSIDAGTKTFTNGITFSQTGTMVFLVRDIATNITATWVLSVLTPPVVPPSGWSSSTPSPGWGGGQSFQGVSYNIISVSNTGDTVNIPTITKPIENLLVLNSAQTEPVEPMFVMQDPSGLLGKLFLTNRYIGWTWSENLWDDSSSQVSDDSVAMTIMDSLDSIILDESEGPIILRQIMRLFLQEVEFSEDPLASYDYGIAKIESIQVESDSRLSFTQEYVLRILEQQRRRYEAEVYRIASWEEDMNSANEENTMSL
jgi:parallel beta-helix repeat protein